MVLKRFVNGAEGEAFFQKRAPESRPAWVDTVELRFPSGRSAVEVVPHDAAALAWMANLGCIDLNPHPVRADDLDHPDELRVDLDPVPGRGVAADPPGGAGRPGVLADFGLTGWPKTSGSRGFHIYARIERRWEFADVRRAAVALAREVERRAPGLATAKWWKEERHGVFLDYNQNAKDRTVASAYSVRPTRDARVSTPLAWDEVPDCEPEAFTIDTVPERFARLGDPWAGHGRRGGLAGRAARPGRRATRRPGCPTRRGRRTMTSRRASRRGCSRPSAGQRPRRRRRASRPGRPGGASPRMPLIEVARAATKDEAMAGLDRWKERHPGGLALPGTTRRAGGLDARAQFHLDQDPAEPAQRARRPAASRRNRSRWTTTRGPAAAARPGG